MESWYQQEFVFDFDPPKKKKKMVDYAAIFELFRNGEVTFRQIEEAAGVSHHSVANVIAVLTLRYPIYDVRRGVYKLVDGADFEKIKRENQ